MNSGVYMPAMEGCTVLLVEDHQSTRALLAEKLRLEGFTVLTAQGEEDALKICRQYPDPIELLIADVPLPGKLELQVRGSGRGRPSQTSGVLLAQQVRFKRPEARVLFISGHADQELRLLGVFREPWPFLRKPFNGDTLVQTVRQVLRTKYPPHVW